MLRRLAIIGYLIVGLLVAANRGYLADLGSISALVSAVLAIILWPLLFFGVNLRLGRLRGGRGR